MTSGVSRSNKRGDMSAHAASASDIFGPARFLKSPPERSRPRKVVRRHLSSQPRPRRTSQVLRDILAKNPDLESFTIRDITQGLGETSFGTALMFFTIPEVIPIPIPGIAAIVVLPTLVISGQMVAGREEIKLPEFLLKRTIPRQALERAIRAVVPLLERAEKVTKPRWGWATTPAARRLLGGFIFLLALAIAFPIPGFNMPQAIATFIIALGLVENDGLLVVIGVLAGLLSLALLGGVVFGLFSFLGLGI